MKLDWVPLSCLRPIGHPSDQELAESLSSITGMLEHDRRLQRKSVMIVEMRKAGALSAPQRRTSSEWMKKNLELYKQCMMAAMAKPTGCVWEILSDSLIVTYTGEGATAEQWQEYMTMIRGARDRGVTRFLIYADASPPANVLADIASVARGQPWQVSLISPSTAVRFAASTFSFVTKGFRFFVPEKVADALAHLGCDVALQERGLAVLDRLRGTPDQAAR